MARIEVLGARNAQYHQFELVPPFDSKEFTDLLRAVPPLQRAIASSIVTPFVEGLESRLNALSAAESLTRTFLEQANRYLRDKRLYFTPRGGMAVRTEPQGDPLEPDQLSSGEKHLALLLCSTLVARERSRLFIIDEPELSLNVMWQRSVLDSLLKITESAPVQFIVATHSVEMVSRHRPSLVRLDPIGPEGLDEE